MVAPTWPTSSWSQIFSRYKTRFSMVLFINNLRFLPHLIKVGLRGLLVSVMLAALMTSLTSVFNSSAAIFTVDIYKRIRRASNLPCFTISSHCLQYFGDVTSSNIRRTRAFETELLVASRCFILVMCAIGVGWIPLMTQIQEWNSC